MNYVNDDNPGIDSSMRLRNFSDNVTHEQGQMPFPSVPNIKTTVLSWFENYFKRYTLKNPVHLLGDYPSELVIAQTINVKEKVSYNFVRGLSVVLLDVSNTLMGIGNVINTQEYKLVPVDVNNPDILGLNTSYGCYETVQLELTYWSFDSEDRDKGSEIIKRAMHEAFITKHFLKNGIIEFKFKNSYDATTDKIVANTMIYMHVMNFTLSRIWFSNVTEKYDEFIDSVEVMAKAEYNKNDTSTQTPYDFPDEDNPYSP